MYTLTIGEFIDREDYSDIPGAVCLYVFRKDSTVFYVGQSRRNAIERVWQHIGPPLGYFGCIYAQFTDIGRFVEANYPQSRDWQLDLLTLEDCAGYTVFATPNDNLDDAEASLTKLLNPCLNRSFNHTSVSQRLAGFVLPWKVSADQWPEM